MSEITFRNFHNAFVNISSIKRNLSIVIDPWVKDGIYNNSWYVNPNVKKEDMLSCLKNADICIVTHIHEDHFDLSAISELNENCKIILPKMWPNPIVVSKKLPERNIQYLELSKSHDIEGIDICFIQPMNGEGHLVDIESKSKSDELVVDTGVIIEFDNKKFTLLADNFPWNYSNISENVIEKVMKSDILAAPFNAFADDYPLCFDNLTNKDKKSISQRRNDKRLIYLSKFINEFKPKNVVPYSSDFFLAGPRSLLFDKCHPDEYKCRNSFGKLLRQSIRHNVIPLSWNQSIILKDKEISVKKEFIATDYKEVCNLLFKKESNVNYEKITNSLLMQSLEKAAKRMFDKMSKMKIESEWVLQFIITDYKDRSSFVVDPDNKKVHNSNHIDERECLTCFITSGHLSNLLNFKTHWDNERISHNLTWKRSIDVYEKNINKAINFLHI